MIERDAAIFTLACGAPLFEEYLLLITKRRATGECENCCTSFSYLGVAERSTASAVRSVVHNCGATPLVIIQCGAHNNKYRNRCAMLD